MSADDQPLATGVDVEVARNINGSRRVGDELNGPVDCALEGAEYVAPLSCQVADGGVEPLL